MILRNIDSSHHFLVEQSKFGWPISRPVMIMTIVFSGRHQHQVISTLNATELDVITLHCTLLNLNYNRERELFV